jgi:hypothetical protein
MISIYQVSTDSAKDAENRKIGIDTPGIVRIHIYKDSSDKTRVKSEVLVASSSLTTDLPIQLFPIWSDFRVWPDENEWND